MAAKPTEQALKLTADMELRVGMKNVEAEWGKTQKTILGSFRDTMAKAVSAGFKQAKISDIYDKMKKQNKEILDSQKRAMDLKLQIEAKAARQESSAAEERALKLEHIKLLGLKDRVTKELHAENKILARRKAAADEAQRRTERSTTEMLGEWNKSLGNIFGDLKSGKLGDLIKGLGKTIQVRSAGMQKNAAEGSAKDKLGGFGGGLASAVIGLGVLVAGFTAVVKLLLGANAQVKKFNQSIFDGGVAAGDLVSSFTDVHAELDKIRKYSVDVQRNLRMGTKPEDILALAGAYQNAGYTLREMGEAGRDSAVDIDAFGEAAEIAVRYAKLLGTTNTEMATNIAGYMEDLGMDINQVEDGLSRVHAAAMDSGFGVKRFFSMVLQATSGMSMYNVRLEEASGLLTRLGRILGDKMGGDVLGQLTKGFGNEGMQERYKRVMMTPGMKGIYQKDAANQAGSLLDSKQKATLAAAAKKAGVDLDLTDGASLAKSLSGLSKQQQADLRFASETEMGAGGARQLRQLMDTAGGAKGGVGNMAMNMGSLGVGGKLAATLTQGSGLFGGKKLHELEDADLMGFEQFSGMSGESLKQLREISYTLNNNYDQMAKIAKSGIPQSDADRRKNAEAYGMVVEGNQVKSAKWDEATGKVVTGEVIKDMGDYLQSQGDVYKDVGKAKQTEAERLANEQVFATTELTAVIELGVQWWLEFIGGYVEKIATFFIGGKSKAKNEAISVLQGREKVASDEAGKIRANLQGLQKQAADMPAGAEKEKLMAEIEKLKGDLQTKQGLVNKFREHRNAVLTYEGGATTRESLLAETSPDAIAAKEAKANATVGEKEKAKRYQDALLKQLTDQMNVKKYGTSDPKEIAARKEERATEIGAMQGSGDTRSQSKEDVLEEYEIQDMADRRKLVENIERIAYAAQNPDAGIDLKTGMRVEGASGSSVDAMSSDELMKLVEPLVEQERKTGEIAKLAEGQEALFKTKIAKANAKEIIDAQRQYDKEKFAANIMNAMADAGMNPNKEDVNEWLKQLENGEMVKGFQDVVSNPEVAAALRRSSPDRYIPGMAKPEAKDFLMQVGGGQVKFAQRIDSADQVTAVASKAGGALSKGGRGEVHNHFYNDGQGIFSSMKRWAQANGQ